MVLKGQKRGKTYKRKTSRHHKSKKRLTSKRLRRLRGGNYERDATTRETDGIPTKSLNKFVVTVPGYGTMSGTAYKRLHAAIDRDGPDAFLK